TRSHELTRGLMELASSRDATLFMALLACFQTLLQRITAQSDVVTGIPIAGRTRAETGNLIGLFVNSLVLRTDLSGDPPFLELLRRVRSVSLGAFAHQDLPFERLVRGRQPPHAPSGTSPSSVSSGSFSRRATGATTRSSR